MKKALNWEGAALIPMAIVIAIGLILWFLPRPEAIEPQGWQLLAIFVATIAGIIMHPLPMGSIAIMGMTVAVVTGTLSLEQTLHGFANEQIWLIVVACFIARGFIKTGLGKRIAYIFLFLFGRSPIGLAYGFLASDFIMAPAIPSSTARAGGVLLPILRSLSQTLGSDPEHGTARKIGAYLTICTFHGTVISTTMFLTSAASNPIIAKFAAHKGIELTWGLWLQASIVPAILSFLLIPIVIYLVYPPEMKNTTYACNHAKEKLAEMGKVTTHEWLMIFTFVMLLVLWIFGREFGLHATTTALIGLCFLMVTGVLNWKEILAEGVAWDSLVWFSVLVMMASFLTTYGVIGWMSGNIVGYIEHLQWHHGLIILTLIYFYIHYFFASVTSHVSALFAPFLAVALEIGTPPMLAGVSLAFFSVLCGGLTHYGLGQAPVLYSTRYVELKNWWLIGALMSFIYLILWAVVGGLWWKWLGIW